MRALLLLAVLLAAGGCGKTQPAPAAGFLATDITGVPWGRDFSLTDHAGKPRSLADFRGKVVALFFGYTHCPEVCPTTLADFAMAVRDLGKDGSRVQVLFVTVDPERDSQALLAKYVPTFNPGFLGMRTDPVSLARLAREFKVVYQKSSSADRANYQIDHTAGTYVFDAHGRLRLLIAYGTGPAAIAQDLRTLLAEQ